MEGRVDYAGAPLVLGTAPAGDSAVPGTDITAASIAQISPLDLQFSLSIANMPPGLNGLPEGVQYNWSIAVSTAGRTSTYMLQALRTGQWARTGAGPVFRLLSCARGDTTGECSDSSALAGTMTETGVTFLVPMSKIDAAPGSSIAAGETGVVTTLGGSGAFWFDNLGGDSIGLNDFTLPQPAVRVGVAREGTPVEAVPLDVSAALTAGRNFSARLSAQPSGRHLIVAEVCYEGTCGTSNVTVTVP